MRDTNREILWASGASLTLLSAFAGALWRSGLLTFTGTEPSAKVVAAALALVGAFIATAGTFIGFLLRYSFDKRSEAQRQLESDRNAAMEREAETRLQIEADRAAAAGNEAEKRLKLEAAIKAIQLFATPDGSASLPIQRSGALFSLSNLGHHTLALSILRQLLLTDRVEARATAEVIDAALRSGDERAQYYAINLMDDFAHALLTPDGCEFPLVVHDGCVGMSAYVRSWAVSALVRLLMARPAAEWQAMKYSAYAVVGALALIWMNESDEGEQHDLGGILRHLLDMYPNLKSLRHPLVIIDISAIREIVNSDTNLKYSSDMSEQLQAWTSAHSTNT